MIMKMNERVYQRVNKNNQGHVTAVRPNGSFAVTYDGYRAHDLRGRLRKFSGGTYWYRPAQATTFVKGNPPKDTEQ
jgi:hypothetical protein